MDSRSGSTDSSLSSLEISTTVPGLMVLKILRVRPNISAEMGCTYLATPIFIDLGLNPEFPDNLATLGAFESELSTIIAASANNILL